MADYTGKNLYIAWVYSGGTVVLNTDFRSLSSSKAIGLVDVTAGPDTDRTYLTTVKDGSYNYGALHQTGGTVIKSALTEGTSGTLIIGPEGTVAGKPKETVPAIVMNSNFNYPYDNAVEVTCTFQKNGAAVDAAF